MKKLLFLLLCCLAGKFALAQETVIFHKRDLMGNLVKLTVTFAKERRDCKVFWEYAGQKREYWVIDTEGAGKTQALTVRYDYKDAVLKRDGQFATLQWKEKTSVEKFGKEISFSEGTKGVPNTLYVIQHSAQDTGFYYVDSEKKVRAMSIEKDSPSKHWDRKLDETQDQVFKLSHYQVNEKITFTIQRNDDIVSILEVNGKKYHLVPSDEN